jgi:hypothetical protein
MADEWYYASDGKQRGPIPFAALRERANHGDLVPADLIWTEGMSQWAPASAVRGLFPKPAPPILPASTSQPLDDYQREQEFETYTLTRPPVSFERRMSAGTKWALAGGVVFFLGLAVMVGIIAAVLVASTPSTRSYAVSLNAQGQTDERLISFKPNERVRITVTTEEWGGVFEPDVDLFVLDPDGNLIAKDDGPEKDCEVSFVAHQLGPYRIIVVLDDGNAVKCTVRY